MEELGVAFDVAAMLGRDLVVEVDRGDRTCGLARAAVDALVGVDEHLDAGEAVAALGGRDAAELVEWYRAHDAVAWADVDAGGIAGADALLGDHVRHAGWKSMARALSSWLE